MAEENEGKSHHRRWAEFRYSVVGRLFAAPPKEGDLADAIRQLAQKTWKHPLTGKGVELGFSTIEAWYYAAKNEKRDPVGRLTSKARIDVGKSRCLGPDLAKLLHEQYAQYPSWSYQLHADNLRSRMEKNPKFGHPPSYPTVRRYMKANGLKKQRRPRSASDAVAINRLEQREVRSYELEHVNALWHLDYHKNPLKVLNEAGRWMPPILLGIFDDHSRLACHLQWYLEETAENLVHAFSQALLKRGVPRELLNDNGSAMVSAEFTSGLTRLGIVASRTLPYSPYQNGKCEFAWNKVDGRLMAMLEGYKDLTLAQLNDVTQAWTEMEYNRQVHRETLERPIDRFCYGHDVGRPSPSPEALRLAFRREVKRKQRRSDGTVTVENQRFEIPSRFRHVEDICIRYAFWDLSYVHLIDYRTGEEIARLYPVDKAKNAEGKRRIIENPVVISHPISTTEFPPLLQSQIDEYKALGLKPAYLPQHSVRKDDE